MCASPSLRPSAEGVERIGEVLTKAEIIETTLREMGPFPPASEDEPGEEALIISVLRDRLPAALDVDIRTCRDFRYLKVECCDTCHHFYPHYEMNVIELPDGSPAWVCDAVEWAIYPERYLKLQNSTAGKSLRQVFNVDE